MNLETKESHELLLVYASWYLLRSKHMDPKKHRTEEAQDVTNLLKQQDGTIKIQFLAKIHDI